MDNCLSGNKYRKLYTLLHTPSNTYTKIISYGGTQSNAMYAISCLCKLKGWEFHYYTRRLSTHLKDTVEGNLELALANGMHLHEVNYEDFDVKIKELKIIAEDKTLVISQGGADAIAKEGVTALANEINIWKESKGIKKLCVVLPSGTGTTALYLQEGLDTDIEVYTSVLVGDEAYQNEQWQRLSTPPYPKILSSDKKRKFAKPYDEYLEIYKELEEQTGIVFDLIYAPLTWMQMMKSLAQLDGEILYIHTGGVSGNKTMLERYEYKKKRQR